MGLPDRTVDGHAATIVPMNVERLPLFHWHPGRRLLAIGSRDGADFAADVRADASTFQRPLHAGMLREAIAKQQLSGIACWWSATLALPACIDAVLNMQPRTLVVATAGIGDAAAVERLLPLVDAWVLLATVEEQPWDQRILSAGRHVEVLLGLDERPLVRPERFATASAVHLVARRPAEAPALESWCDHARTVFADRLPVYDHQQQHTRCRRCGEVVVWRHGARSRIDGPIMTNATGSVAQVGCASCGEGSVVQAERTTEKNTR